MDNRHINTREFKSDTSRQAEMASLIRQLAPHEGHTKSLLDGVRLMRADHPLGRTPVLYEPSIVIVCQGHKRGYLANQVYHYDAQHYLVLSVPLPFSTETEASPERAFAGCLRSSRHDRRGRSDHRGRSTGHQSGKPARRHRFHAIGRHTGRYDGAAASRIVFAAGSKGAGACHRAGIVFPRSGGRAGRCDPGRLGKSHGNFGRIARVLRRIHSDYAQQLDVSSLASEAGLSTPAFHAHFKAVTATSPIQYIKSVRLHQALFMMIRDDVTAAGAAARVGYESASQFNREFKRLFGRSRKEAREMRSAFALMAPAQLEAVAATH